ncbi:molybdopterin-dependent oxidoreductase [Nocardia sp. alder85J]|uniref:molybdopterin-dependent oxidoreductase n=1 Tax=Nocardia sp. alder85J TaxID=2862949 RepID=UPI001CD6DA84|nr:molybdopterin-dependent oxidoreductase [Nocardia sp. alder85J]MCX4094721.1 molybdopterin-dependent oxidoreductase [Nocardia sp. alder85J]
MNSTDPTVETAASAHPGRSPRGPEVAARVGIALGTAILVCFVTGLLSHWIQHPPTWFRWPVHPVWLYRLTQGAHVVSGVAAVPLVLVKLWSVYPRLFQKLRPRSPLWFAERGSIALLVGSVLFELSTGLANIAQYYPWKFFFPAAHYAMAYVAIGAMAVHLAVKLPVIREALARPADTPPDPGPGRVRVSRRAVLGAAWAGAAVAALSVAGQTVPFLRWAALLAPRSGHGPQGVPVNRTAAEAGVATTAAAPGYRLVVAAGDRSREFTRAELTAMPQAEANLPIACVEGWSAAAHWSGVRLRDLLDTVGYRGGDVRLTSLEQSGLYRGSVLPAPFAADRDTLIALALNGEPLDLDHGYPCRLIAPNRPGVLQTKWLSRIEVSA